MAKKCNHIIGYFNDYCDKNWVYKEKEMLEILKEKLWRSWFNSIDFKCSCDDVIDKITDNYYMPCYYWFFDYCPECGEFIDGDKISKELSQKLCSYCTQLNKDKTKVNEKIKWLREQVDNLERGVE